MAPRLGLGGGVSADPASGLFAASFLLDNNGDDCYGAYSLRQISGAATNVCQCIRDSDSATQDFTAAELTDGTLTTFGAGTNARVKTLYDQSGNDNHATQTSLYSCPTVVLSGTAELDGNGLPWMNFDGTNDFIPLQTALPNIATDSVSSFVVGKFDATAMSALESLLSLGRNHPGRLYLPYGYNSEFGWGYGSDWDAVTHTADTDVHLFTAIAGSTQGDFECWEDTTSKGTVSLESANTSGTYGIGGLSNTTQYALDGKVQEVIIFDADKSVERTTIQSAIMSYYNL